MNYQTENDMKNNMGMLAVKDHGHRKLEFLV